MKVFLRGVVLLTALVLLTPSLARGQFLFFQNPNVGKAAPDFTLATLDGDEVNMTQYREGKRAIIFFWATWCPHCRVALKELN